MTSSRSSSRLICAFQAATASGVNHTVRLPRARRAASYSAQLVTRCCCLGMWRRQAALALNGTAEIRVSGKEPSSYTAQLPTPTGRSVQQGASDIHTRFAEVIHWTLVMVGIIPAIHWTLVMRNLDFGDDSLDFGDANRRESGLSTGLW